METQFPGKKFSGKTMAMVLRMVQRGRLSPRERRRLSAAISAVRAGMTLREAERTYRIARSTIHLHCAAPAGPVEAVRPLGRPPAFDPAEEEVVVDLLCRYANRGLPLARAHLEEAFAILISRLPDKRQRSLPFKNGRPGPRFHRNFIRRNRDRLRFARPLRQEGKRFAAANAEVLTMHFAVLGKVYDDLGVDASRVWNLDETGATPGKDVDGAPTTRHYLTRQGGSDMRVADFKQLHRITMMPVVSAAGDYGPTLFVFKGRALPYRSVVRGGHVVAETYAEYLPRNAVISTRDDRGGVDGDNFLQWAKLFVAHVKDLTAGGRKVLLTYDAYRSHMTLRALELFEKNNVQVYALPAHTSGKTQPCDVVLFGVFKRRLNEAVQLAGSADNADQVDAFAFCAMMRFAFYKAFTRQNIQASFTRAGLWPLDATRLLSVPRPRSASNVAETIAVDALQMLYEQKREAVRTSILGDDAKVGQCGFLDTTNGLVLTSARSMELVRAKFKADTDRRRAKEVSDNLRAVKASRRDAARRTQNEKMRNAVWAARARMAGMPEDEFRASVRPLAQRRAIARLRTSLRRTNTDCVV
eukprot:IDg2526t1